MSSCCDPEAYAQLFDEKNAKRDVREYRERGVDGAARRMLDAVIERGVVDASVLEVGGGVGALQIELLRAGAARATNVELVGTYERPAHELLESVGLSDRVDRQLLDFAREGQHVANADIVVLHRVICCYPDMESLVRRSADHAGRILALSFPADRWWWRVGRSLSRVWFVLRGCGFRLYLHDPRRILATAESAGLRPIFHQRGWLWQVAVLERPVS